MSGIHISQVQAQFLLPMFMEFLNMKECLKILLKSSKQYHITSGDL